MRLKVENKYEDEDLYDCDATHCDGCGLRFVCYTERDEVELNWKSFCAVLKSTDKPALVYRG